MDNMKLLGENVTSSPNSLPDQGGEQSTFTSCI